MKYKIFLCCVLLLGGLMGCSTTTPRAGLYLHLLASSLYPTPPRLILSIPIQLSEEIDVPLSEGRYLKGHIRAEGKKFVGDLKGYFCRYTNVFHGDITLGERFTPWGEPYDSKAPFVCQPIFMLSSNRNAKAFLKDQTISERKRGERKPGAEAELHFRETFLGKCNTNEIRCLWFLRGQANIGMERTIDLKEGSMNEEREVYNWAWQGEGGGKLSYHQVFTLKNIIRHLPPSDKEAASVKSVFISVRTGNKVTVFQYNRYHLPPAVQRVYDIAGGYVEDGMPNEVDELLRN